MMGSRSTEENELDEQDLIAHSSVYITEMRSVESLKSLAAKRLFLNIISPAGPSKHKSGAQAATFSWQQID